MYKKILMFLLVISLFIFIIGCGTPEPKEEMNTRLLTRTYTSQDENSTMRIMINNLDNTGSVEMTLFIQDKDEWWYALDERTYTANEIVESEGGFSLDYAVCGLLWTMFRDYEIAKKEYSNTSEWTNETLTDEETKEQKTMDEFMKGFKATGFSLKFVDKEDKSTILKCYNTGLGEKDLEIKAYNTTSQREIDLAEEEMWGDYEENSESNILNTEQRTEYASCESFGCDENHIAVGDKSTNQWYYCDCFGVESIASEDRTCFSSIGVAEAVGYYKAWDCE